MCFIQTQKMTVAVQKSSKADIKDLQSCPFEVLLKILIY